MRETITDLAALVQENRGSSLESALVRAEMLARGSAADFEGAFALAAGHEAGFVADLWRLLATSGPDSALLAQAVLPADMPVPALDAPTRQRIGDRLLGLGFPDESLRWFQANGDPANTARIARAELGRGDGRAALRSLGGQSGPESDFVRAQALARLGNQSAAAAAFASAGDDRAEAASLWRAQDWAATGAKAPDPQRAALQILSPATALPPPDATAPLAHGRALLDESAKARAAILALLQATPGTEGASP